MGDYYRFRVQLAGVKPPIFRRFLLKASATFHDLHMAIQTACGWENGHLFAFRPSARGESLAGIPDPDGFEPPEPNAKKVKLATWFSLTGNKDCCYEYDFGDSWLHDVRLETIEKHDGAFKRRLLDGARSFPPEDCGGLGGYDNCLAVAAGSDGDDELREWLGDWDPENFDLVGTKRRFDM